MVSLEMRMLLACHLVLLTCASAPLWADCSGIRVERNGEVRSYPPGPGCDGLLNEVSVGETTVTFLDLARSYNGQDSTVYYIYVNYSTPVTVRMGAGSNPQNKNIAVSLRYGQGSSSWVPFTSVDIDLSDCQSSHVLTSYVGDPSETDPFVSDVTQVRANGECSLWVKGDVTGPIECEWILQTVIIRRLTSTGSVVVNGDIADLTVGQPEGDYWGPQACEGLISCTGSVTDRLRIFGTLIHGTGLTGTIDVGGDIAASVLDFFITEGSTAGAWVHVAGDALGDVRLLSNFQGDICAANLDSSNVMCQPNIHIEPGCEDGVFQGTWTVCEETPSCLACPATEPDPADEA